MRGVCLDRLISASEFVPALGAGLDPRQPAFNRDIDCLIIAQFEMQKPHIARASPIAPIDRIRSHPIERAGDRIIALVPATESGESP